MRRLFPLLVLLPLIARAQQPASQQVVRGTANLRILDAQALPDGGVLLAGYRWDNSPLPATHHYIARIDSAGQTVWSRSYLGSEYTGTFGAVRLLPAGAGFILAGVADSAGSGPRMLISRVDATGFFHWHRQVATPGYSWAAAADEVPNGFVCAGETLLGGAFSGIATRTNLSGNAVWSRVYRLPGESSAFRTVTAVSGGLLLGGRAGDAGSADIWIVRTAATGDTVWTRRYDSGSGEDEVTAALPLPGGGFLFTGRYAASGTDSCRIFLLQTDSLGQRIRSRSYAIRGYDVAASLSAAPGGGYLVAGLTRGATAAPASNDAFLLRTDDTGTVLWTRLYGGGGSDEFGAGRALPGGGFLGAGTTASYSPTGDREAYLVRTDGAGHTPCDTRDTTIGSAVAPLIARPSAPADTAAGTPVAFYMLSVPEGIPLTRCRTAAVPATGSPAQPLTIAPHPVADRVVLTAAFPIESLILTDLTGKAVWVQAAAGARRLDTGLGHLPSGVYFYSVATTGGIYRGRLVVHH